MFIFRAIKAMFLFSLIFAVSFFTVGFSVKFITGDANAALAIGFFTALITSIAAPIVHRKAKYQTDNIDASPSVLNTAIQDSAKPSFGPNSRGTVRFKYETQEGVEGIYTVQVYKYKNGKFTGYCHERDGERSFFPDAVIDEEVIDVNTGEVIDIFDWLSANFSKRG